MVNTSDLPITVDGVRLDTLAWNVTKISQQTAGRRTADMDSPLLDGVTPSVGDPLEPARFGLEMWVRGTDHDGVTPTQGSVEVFRDNLDELVHLFGKRHALLDVQEQAGPGNDFTNLVTNPNMAPGTITVTNLVTNPSSQTVWSAEGSGTGTAALDTTRSIVGANSTKATWSSGTWGLRVTPSVTVTANTTYTVSVWIYLESGAIPVLNVGDSAFGLTQATSMASAATGIWKRFSTTYTTGASQTTLRVWTHATSATVYNLDGAMVTQGITLHDYFDGATANTANHTHAWTGTAHASTSTRVGLMENGRNLAKNPQPGAVAGMVGTYGTGGAGSIALETGGPHGSFMRKTWSTAMTGGDAYTYSGNAGGSSPYNTPVVPGRAYSFSAMARASKAASVYMHVIYYDVAGNSVGAATTASQALAANQWGTFTRPNFVAPAGAYSVLAMLRTATLMGVGDWIDYHALSITEGITVPPTFFSGDTPSDGTHTNAWTGTAHASESVRWVTPVLGYSNPDQGSTTYPDQGTYGRLYRWGTDGLAVETTGSATTYTFAGVPVSPTVTPGEWLTVSAEVETPTPLVGPYNTDRENIHVLWSAGAATTRTDTAAPSSGVRTVSSTFQVPSTGVSSMTVRLGLGVSTVDGVRQRAIFRKVLVVRHGTQRPVTPPTFFSGDTPDTNGTTYAWTGTANNSTSTRTPSRRRAWCKVSDVIAPDLNAISTTATFAVGLVIPSGMWEDVNTQDWTQANPTVELAYEVTTLAGASEHINDAIFLVTGPLNNVGLYTDDRSMSVFPGVNIPAGQQWRFNSATWESVTGTGVTFTSTGHTDRTATTTVNGPARGYGLPLIPKRDTGARRVKVILSGSGNTSATTLAVRARRKYAL